MADQRRVLTIRVPAEMHETLHLIARGEDVSLNEVAMAALDLLIARRRNDSAFMERIRTVIEQEQATLERLAR